MDVREMKPGRELDALVAEKIFDKQFYRAPMTEWRGRYVYKEFWDDPNSYYNEWHRSQEIGEWEYCGPNYSTDISAAWKVVEKMGIPFFVCKSYEHQFEVGELGWCVNWCKKSGCDIGYRCEHGNDVWSLSAPEAICKAALMALEDKA